MLLEYLLKEVLQLQGCVDTLHSYIPVEANPPRVTMVLLTSTLDRKYVKAPWPHYLTCYQLPPSNGALLQAHVLMLLDPVAERSTVIGMFLSLLLLLLLLLLAPWLLCGQVPFGLSIASIKGLWLLPSHGLIHSVAGHLMLLGPSIAW